MTRAAERLFALVRATLRNRMDDASLFEGTDAAQWREIYDLSSVQGVLAQNRKVVGGDGRQLIYVPMPAQGGASASAPAVLPSDVLMPAVQSAPPAAGDRPDRPSGREEVER